MNWQDPSNNWEQRQVEMLQLNYKESEKEEEEESPSLDRTSSPVSKALNTLLRKKKIKQKNGDREEYVINPNKMEILQRSNALTKQEKDYLKKNQLNLEMIQYVPKEQSDDDSDAKSIDTIEDQTGHLQNLKDKQKSLFQKNDLSHKKDSSMDLLRIIVRKVIENKQEEAIKLKKTEDFTQDQGVKRQITIREMMDGLKKRQWVYMKHLLAFLRHKCPFEYNKFPAFYDELSEVLVIMNQESVDGLVEVYKRCTIWLHKDFPGKYPVNSKFRKDSQEHIFQHGIGVPLHERYSTDSVWRLLRMEPQGIYTNEAHLVSFQVPLNISYGSAESLAMLKSLEKCQNNQIFKLPAVQGYLNYKWDQSRKFLLAEAVLHFLFLISFSVFAVNDKARNNNVSKGVVLFFCLIFALREILQIAGRKSSYFCDPFNYPDVGMIICAAIAVIVSGTSAQQKTALQWPIVIAILLLYARSISYFRLWRRTRHLIRSIVQTFIDMVPFVMILIVLIFAYATAYIASFEPEEFKNFHYGFRIFKGFQLLFGAYEDPENSAHYFVFIIMAIIILVVLLNMLIAIMGDTFGRVQSNKVVYDYRERLSVNIDLESMIYLCARNRRRLYHIGMLRRPGGYDLEDESFTEQNKLLRKLIKENLKRIDEIGRVAQETRDMVQETAIKPK